MREEISLNLNIIGPKHLILVKLSRAYENKSKPILCKFYLCQKSHCAMDTLGRNLCSFSFINHEKSDKRKGQRGQNRIA